MATKKFILEDFKHWLSNQNDMPKFKNLGIAPQDSNDVYIGGHAKTRVCEKRLIERIKCDDDPETLVQEFIENGGQVISIDKKMVYIEGNSGNFYLPRFCIKIKKL